MSLNWNEKKFDSSKVIIHFTEIDNFRIEILTGKKEGKMEYNLFLFSKKNEEGKPNLFEIFTMKPFLLEVKDLDEAKIKSVEIFNEELSKFIKKCEEISKNLKGE